MNVALSTPRSDSQNAIVAPAIIRGEVIATNMREYGGRAGDVAFLAPDPMSIVDRLPLGNPAKMADLYTLSIDEIIDYLVELGARLEVDGNPHLLAAREATYGAAPVPPSLTDRGYAMIAPVFQRHKLEAMVDSIGREYLEGWAPYGTVEGRRDLVRAFGSRALHIVAGNGPVLAALTIIRNALTRSDAIIKAPSNDPFTAIAIVRTMIDMAPDHPLTKHVSVAYWKGGDEAFEQRLIGPHAIEKIIAWGGFASVKHVTKYIQPGLELLSLDPKRSISVLGKGTFASEADMEEAAQGVATDIGGGNQTACCNARVVYVQSGADEEGIAKLERFGRLVYDKMMALGEHVSTKPRFGIGRELKANLDACAMSDDWYTVIGGDDDEGAIVVSKLPEPVDFATSLDNRVANLVPIDDFSEVYARMDSYCQTVGVYPESLIPELRDGLARAGAQRVVKTGNSMLASFATPQDAIEVMRRMLKWVVHESVDLTRLTPAWNEFKPT